MKKNFQEYLQDCVRLCTFASASEGQALVERKFFDRLAQVRDGAPRVPLVVWRGGCSVAGAALKVKF